MLLKVENNINSMESGVVIYDDVLLANFRPQFREPSFLIWYITIGKYRAFAEP